MMTSVEALADTTATVATPEASNASVTKVETPTYKKIIDRMNVTFLSEYLGSSVGKISDARQPDEYGRTKEGGNGKPTTEQEFDNTLLTTYKINDNGLVAGVGLNESYYINGRGHELVDSYVKVGKTNLYKNGNFNYNADLRAYAPFSKKSHNKDQLTRFRSVSLANYDIPNTKFSLQSWQDLNYYVFGSNAAVDARDAFLMAQPTINYQPLESLGFFVAYEFDLEHYKNSPTFDLTHTDTYLYLGTSWDITPKANFSPELAFRPGGAMNLDSTQIIAYFTYKIL
jgi:hypothetical protein